MLKLSIIIPVYNVEKYIGTCLESIFSQNVSEREYEVIIINDGTPDNSMTVVQDYVSRSNIKIVNQENKGLSCARNRGIQEAQGEYVWFVDSDDYVSEDSISTLLKLIEKEHADVYTFCHRRVFEHDKSMEPEQKGIREGYMPIEDFCNTPLCMSCAQFYVFNRNFFVEKNLFFHEGVYHEDMEFIAKVRVLCDKVYVSQSTLYYYLIREAGSIMTSFNVKKHHDCIAIADELLRFKQMNTWTLKKKMSLNKSIAYILILSILTIKKYYEAGNAEAKRFVSEVASIITFRKYWRVFMHYKPSLYVYVCMLCVFVSPKIFLFLYPKRKSI